MQTRSAKKPRRRILASPLRLVVIGLAAMAIVVGGVAVGRHLSADSPPVAGNTAEAPKPTPVSLPAAPSPMVLPDGAGQSESGRFEAEFAALEATLDADVGVVVRPVGTGPAPVAAGEQGVDSAWSTIKVPLAIAGLRAADPPEVTDVMRAAITRSDNAAAESIWQSLGDPATAAQKVQDVLAQTGDPTVVESEKVRPEFTAFGQTIWSLANQAMFLSSAVCDVRNEPIMSLMSEIEPGQRWGLAVIPGVRSKGGWGPSESGAYLVRQMGIVPLPAGSAVVTVAATPRSGSFEDGARVLTQIADWLSQHDDLLPAGNCPSP
ncbi:uncharacterized protein RMCN_1566 [Mycolicibacterium novocastrense]|uniref:Beta-lactamase class A n=1 Tax=Mycolicibacterium novocastrense TaxID=59813 RepID=A0ABQ0KFW0_MYCNV|nr:uncharacterized protein RMCN_1566 [Mycolicibacterium novocastrense]